MKKWTRILLWMCVLSLPASAAITHRYDFTYDANDVVGGLVSTLVGDAQVADGSLVLDGSDDWLELDGPGISLNTYTEGTSLEFWFSLNAVGGWTRVFDFGDTNGTDGGYCLFYTPSGPGYSRLAISTGGFPSWSTGEQVVNGPALEASQEYHVVCVYEPGGGQGGASAMRIYQNGVEVASNPAVTMLLTGIRNNYALLGKALYSADPELNGSIREFRIYDKPLSAAEVRFTNYFGPDNAYPIVIRGHSPADGAIGVPVTPELSWTLEPDITAVSYTLYLGDDPNLADPNIADVSVISDLIVTGLTSPSYTIPIQQALQYSTTYYWRVDTTAADMTVYQGVGIRFTTIPETPVFEVHPTSNYVAAGQTAQFTAECESVSPLSWVKWYKVGTPDVEITTADPDVTIQTINEGNRWISTLSIANAASADEGRYYAKAQNEAGTSQTSMAWLVIKKLVAYWAFDDNLQDSSGNGYHGTGMSSTTGQPATLSFTTGIDGAGRSVVFNGTSQYIDLVDGLADTLRGGMTITLWAYPQATSNWARFASFSNGAASDNIFFSREGTSATLHFNVFDGAIGTGPVTAANAIELNKWQMFTVTVDETGSTILYKNGVPIATGQVELPNEIERTQNWLGRSAWSADALYRGRLDEMRLYNYALTPAEVATLYTNVRTTEFICVPDPENPLDYDLTGDCRVNLDDLAIMVGWWTECMRVPDEACTW